MDIIRHIPQPPHSAGLSYKGLRASIDPYQIPSVVDTIDTDRQLWEQGEAYMTLSGEQVPLPTSDFVAVDQGNSSPKFMRVSTWNFPCSSRLTSDCHVPLAAVIQPFADLDPREEPIPLVDTGDLGPARCNICRGYINPWCTWLSRGSVWKCNLCHHENPVHPDYFCDLDPQNFLRRDHLQRPELHKGTIDFVVHEEYWANSPPPKMSSSYISVNTTPTPPTRKPEPLNYVFAFDVSAESVECGFLASSCNALRSILFDETGEGVMSHFAPETKIAIITFDQSIHFHDLSSDLERARILVVADLEEVFVPSQRGILVNPVESRNVIQNLLGELSHRFIGTAIRKSALGSALAASLATLAGRGGQVVVFQATFPTVGLGALEPLESENMLYGTEKESLLYSPRHTFWPSFGEECAEEGVGVSMFLGMSRFIDVGSIGCVASTTGGELFYHPRFVPHRDGSILTSQLQRLVTRTTGYDCIMRVRCSNDLRVSSQYGNFYAKSATEMEFGTLDADKAVVVQFKHKEAMDKQKYAYIQSATLYTSSTGQRRVRMCNMAIQVVSLAGNVFRFADEAATVSFSMRRSISKLSQESLLNIRDELTTTCSSILIAYRHNCAAHSPSSQLIIPESFRGLSIYSLAMMKSKVLKDGYVSADVRNYHAHKMNSVGVRSTLQHLYPPLMSIHDLDDSIALPELHGDTLLLPSLMRNSHIFMEPHGIYLIDNEETTMIWIGGSASPQLLLDLFDVDDILHLDVQLAQLPELPTILSSQVRNILGHRLAQRGRATKLVLVRQNMDGSEIEFSDMLVEDQNNSALSYIDYLSLLHKNISTGLKRKTADDFKPLRSPW